MARPINDGISIIVALISVFGIYFLYSAPSSVLRSSEINRSEQPIRERSNETPSLEPTYDLASLPPIEVGQTIEFGLDSNNRARPANRALLVGWSVPEPGGIWSLGKNAAIGFVVRCGTAVCATDEATLLFEGMVFVTAGHPRQTIEVWSGTRKVDQVTLSSALTKFAITLDGVTVKDGTPIVLSLRLPDAIVQGKVTNSLDPREVAFRIKSFRLEL